MMTIWKDVPIIAASDVISSVDQSTLPQFKVTCPLFLKETPCPPLTWAISSPAFTHSVGTYVENTWNRWSQCYWWCTKVEHCIKHIYRQYWFEKKMFQFKCVFKLVSFYKDPLENEMVRLKRISLENRVSKFQFVLSLEIYKISFKLYQQD